MGLLLLLGFISKGLATPTTPVMDPRTVAVMAARSAYVGATVVGLVALAFGHALFTRCAIVHLRDGAVSPFLARLEGHFLYPFLRLCLR